MNAALFAPGPEVAQRLRTGVAAQGFAAVDGLIPQAILAALRCEARAQVSSATGATGCGAVAYRASMAALGPLAQQLLFGPTFLDLLTTAANACVAPSEERSCLTVYRAGDHLGAHLDEPESECGFTAILYLEAIALAGERRATGLELRVYEEDWIPGAPPRLVIPTVAGRLVVGRGARIWHERPALQAGEYVLALTACYRLLAGCWETTARV